MIRPTGKFIRDRLPDWLAYAYREGIVVEGRGKWRNILCDFHDDHHPSLRIKPESGGWCCMSCGASGGDVLSHYMRRAGLEFIDAVKALGAWDENGTDKGWQRRPRSLSPRDALELVYVDSMLVWVVACDMSRGVAPTDSVRASLSDSMRHILLAFEGVNE